jgi:hypothetical protein
MKIAFLVVLATLAGCWLPPGPHPNPRIHVEPPPDVDVDTPSETGTMCVGTNIEAEYTVTDTFDGTVKVVGESHPQDPTNLTNCFSLEAGSYVVTFLDQPGYLEPPPAEPLNLMVGGKIKVYGYYEDL